jgi:stage II sporulation protein D
MQRTFLRQLTLPKLILAMLTLAMLGAMTGCPTTPHDGSGNITGRPEPITPPQASNYTTEPNVRIRVGIGQQRVTLTGPASLLLSQSSTSESGSQTLATPLVLWRRGGAFYMQTTGGQALAWNVPRLSIRSSSSALIEVDNTDYPGSIVLEPLGPDSFDTINHVPLEQYLPGVLDGELYKSWHGQTYATLAIAARSYALAISARKTARHYDLESTTASQMYHGHVQNEKAIQGVRQTRGQVLTYQGRVLPAYYSSAAGDTSQDAAVAFSDAPDLPPLRGRFLGGWDSSSPNFRWGPFNRTRSDIARRLAAWGRANSHPIAALSDIAQIAITSKTSAGRPAQFSVVDSAGRRYDLRPEEFRFGCNFASPPAIPALAKESQLRSAHVQVRVTSNYVQFYDGRGFGHGVGLSQFGAQAMALAGHSPVSILAFYYPGSSVQKIY